MSNQQHIVIIGGGQAGLSVSYHLKQRDQEHMVLERFTQPGHAWRDDRWDSFTLVTPNWSFRLPGAEYQGPDPEGFMQKAEIIERFEQYAGSNSLPVQYGVTVHAVEHKNPGYSVTTDHGSFWGEHVVIATGMFQKPKIPAFSKLLDSTILQLHSGQYRCPDKLPAGAVLVVGSGQSGCQIAEELMQAGRKVYLSVGNVGHAPRRYRGRDTLAWLNMCGFLDRTPEKLPSPQARFAANPLLSGKNGGHSLNLHQFYKDGIILLGRLQGNRDGTLVFACDLKEKLAFSDEVAADIVKLIDKFIADHAIDAPEEDLPALQYGFAAPETPSLNLKASGITAIIWAMGYSFDFSLVRLPVFDESGFPITDRGITRYPGLYFAGLPWLNSQKSGLLLGVGEQAAYIADHIGSQS